MEGVKRAKSVQKKIVHNILSVLFANSDAFSIGRVENSLSGNISLPACSFGGIFIHRSLQGHQNYTLAYPLRLYVTRALEEYWKSENRREAIARAAYMAGTRPTSSVAKLLSATNQRTSVALVVTVVVGRITHTGNGT